jgi:hypothetical protein
LTLSMAATTFKPPTFNTNRASLARSLHPNCYIQYESVNSYRKEAYTDRKLL